MPPRLADNIPDKKKVHAPEFNPVPNAGKPLAGRSACLLSLDNSAFLA